GTIRAGKAPGVSSRVPPEPSGEGEAVAKKRHSERRPPSDGAGAERGCNLMDREAIKREIRARYTEYLQPARKTGYICPKCGNGTGQDGDGMTIDPHGDGM